ncbi:extracellular catalytic domain type 1 short-chain-length polyhydroxyalkanoate depolymerase [Cellulomonas fengjieae]|uniref:PHB depolymerase family esterase n=1 Tax=Cellulomonas fengjieae TaxID=2819978 RepID=A0ABS3SD63_9CELL|nr:PHB depolymerase family esterase [Cellulomonas fengjieae]MBO3083678.1 PHB depolymerase family esterase [Cellulomonas fengjieae]QVI65015.1 PHB depolymerase family esterase [Cellulomonas fengjieae]
MKPSLRRAVAAATTLALGVVGLAVAALTTAPAAQAASLVSVPSFGSNPGGLGMSIFVPDSLPARPAVLVAVHYCTGSAQAMYDGSQFDELATRYGYIVIYPQANRSGSCFDVSSSQALTHGGASDPASIVSMVRYVQQRYATDTGRVFVTGVSSGAMMTEVLLATYPDVFAAGSAFAGVPATCFSTTSPPPGTTSQAPWNSDCSGGRLVRTDQQWGDLARAAYPGYTGPRPRVQLWHGSQDTTLSYVNFGEAIKQWTDVLGVSATPASTDSPASGQTRTRYGATGDRAPVEAISLQGVGHNLPVDAAAAIRFFGLDSPVTPTTPAPTTPAPTTPAPTTPAPTTPAPTTPPPTPSGSCTVAYSVNQWNTGFTANITVTSAVALSGWTLTWTYPSGQTVTQAWSSVTTQSGSVVTARNAAWNGTIPAGGSTQFGLNGAHSGTNTAPATFALNGTPCARA